VDNEKSQVNSQEVPSEEYVSLPMLETVTAERDKLAAEKAELEDRLLRARAEFQNARMRA